MPETLPFPLQKQGWSSGTHGMYFALNLSHEPILEKGFSLKNFPHLPDTPFWKHKPSTIPSSLLLLESVPPALPLTLPHAIAFLCPQLTYQSDTIASSGLAEAHCRPSQSVILHLLFPYSLLVQCFWDRAQALLHPAKTAYPTPPGTHPAPLPSLPAFNTVSTLEPWH